jgi:predicted small metal-binding protein
MPLMFQSSENLLRHFHIRCSDVGLNCDYVSFDVSEEKTINTMVIHMDEYHAINPKEMTTCMRLKIRESMHPYQNLVRAQILNEFSDVSEKLLLVS